MELNGTNIMSVGMMAQDFSMEALWNNVLNGTLALFEQERVDTDMGLRDDICQILSEIQNNTQPEFVSQEKLVLDKMREKLWKYKKCSENQTEPSDFFSRDWENIERISAPLQVSCSNGQAWKLYLLLLLHFQARAKKPLRDEDIDYLLKSFSLNSEKGKNTDEQGNILIGNRIFLVDRNLLYAKENVIYLWSGNGWKEFWREDFPFRGFACSESYGLIACMADGSMPRKTHSEIKQLAEGKKIKEVSAYGRCVLLLTEDGELLTNLETTENEKRQIVRWSPVVAIQAGLNSFSCIAGGQREVRQIGSDAYISDYTGVKMVRTRTDEDRKRYIILRNDGSLYTDDLYGGALLSGVQCCSLGGRGYVYIVRKEGIPKLFLRDYDMESVKEIYDFPPGFQTKELCVREDAIACFGIADNKEVLFFRQESSENMRQLPHIEE